MCREERFCIRFRRDRPFGPSLPSLWIMRCLVFLMAFCSRRSLRASRCTRDPLSRPPRFALAAEPDACGAYPHWQPTRQNQPQETPTKPPGQNFDSSFCTPSGDPPEFASSFGFKVLNSASAKSLRWRRGNPTAGLRERSMPAPTAAKLTDRSRSFGTLLPTGRGGERTFPRPPVSKREAVDRGAQIT